MSFVQNFLNLIENILNAEIIFFGKIQNILNFSKYNFNKLGTDVFCPQKG